MGFILIEVGGLGTAVYPGDSLKTMALGSCVGVVIHSRARKVAGLLHVALPDSAVNERMARERPGFFADTGIPLLLERLKVHGCVLPRDMTVKLVGGAQILDASNTFNIGKRNILEVRKILWEYRLGPLAMDVGGTISRTVVVNPADGMVTISSPGRGSWQI